jgi:diguanylate cyclase (GGDEF)-like protein
MAETGDPPQATTLRSRLTATMEVPVACAAERDRVVRARVRALSPVLAALTIAWIVPDGLVLRLADAVPLGLARIGIAGALVLLARSAGRLSTHALLRAFVWIQALGFGAMQLFVARVDIAGAVGYGLFPFVIVAQLALFPAPWSQTLRAAAAPAAALGLLLALGGPLSPADWRDIWLLVLLTALAAWTAQSQLRLLVVLLGARRDATHDALTGLANRRRVDARLAFEEARMQRHAGPLSVLMLDLDHFKRVNDEYGHAAGDAVLAAAARALADELRAVDLGARFGGEEFLAVLPDTPLDDGMRVAERVRRRIAALRVAHGAATITVTVSIGVAQMHAGESVGELLARVDAALYRAKRDGRNCCVAAPAPVDPAS